MRENARNWYGGFVCCQCVGKKKAKDCKCPVNCHTPKLSKDKRIAELQAEVEEWKTLKKRYQNKCGDYAKKWNDALAEVEKLAELLGDRGLKLAKAEAEIEKLHSIMKMDSQAFDELQSKLAKAEEQNKIMKRNLSDGHDQWEHDGVIIQSLRKQLAKAKEWRKQAEKGMGSDKWLPEEMAKMQEQLDKVVEALKKIEEDDKGGFYGELAKKSLQSL